jgi:hypothetical protein
MPWIAHIDVDTEEHAIAFVSRDGEGLRQALIETSGHDLGHLVRAHSLLGHPVEGFGSWPVAAQTHLQETIAALEEQLSDAGTVSPELIAAVAAVKSKAQEVDDLIPDAPAPVPVE